MSLIKKFFNLFYIVGFSMILPLQTSFAQTKGILPNDLKSYKSNIATSGQIKKIKQKIDKQLTESKKKLSTDLLQLIDSRFLPEGTNIETHAREMENIAQFRPSVSIKAPEDRINEGEVYVYIYLKSHASTKIIDSYVEKVTDKDEKNHIVVAWVKVKNLESLASIEGIRTIRTVMPPIVRTGSVVTEGDAIHRSSEVRSIYSQGGSGIKVGIISDGVDSRATSQSSGDLPDDGSGLTVLSNTQGGDEGTAMLEIVHDMIPDADLYFHDCWDNTVGFNSAIDSLVSAGCNVICDDIGWILEPFFEDGNVASHVSSVLSAQNIVYVSSAGNAGNKHYQGDYYPIPSSTQHDFSRGASDYYLYLNMEVGDNVIIALQWNDQFGSSGNDYDLFLYSYSLGGPVAASTGTQDGDDDPLEYIVYTATVSSAGDFAIVVDKDSGIAKTLEVYIYPRGAGVYSNNITPVDAIFGHAAVTGAIATGAIDASDPGNDDIELFSSQGPSTISYPFSESRAKPDICGIDGVSVTGAGGFPSTFFGTSAAAPHVAAIAGQLWAQLPGKTGNQIRDMITGSAVDLGSTGFDNIYGYGRADALNAFNDNVYVATPTFSPSPGTYDAAQDVTISCATPDAVIHYTTNGNDPTESDPTYSDPIHIASTTTLKARAYKSGWNPSDIASGIYTIVFIIVTSPNGSEDWQVASSHDVTWTSSGTSGSVLIQYSTDSGSSWSDVITDIPDTGAFAWTIPNTPSDSCLLHISDTIGSPSDTCDAIFSISPIPYITVTSPNGGEDFQVDSVHNITWNSSGTSGGVLIQFSTDSGSSWSDVIASMHDTGAFPWTIPDTPSDNCLVRIADTNGILADTSDAIFKISPIPLITAISPNGGEDFQVDSIHNVTWTSSGTSNGVKIEYSTDNGESWSNVIASIPDTGVYPWTIPDTPSDSCLVRVADTNGSLSDTSDAIFKISPIPFITVISPNGGEDFQVDSIHDVTWTSSGTSGGVLIQYSTDSGSSWSNVIASMPDTGAYPWTIPDTPSDSCLVRVADTNENLADTSDAIFKISPIPYITITAPNGGEDWGRSYSYNITWTSSGTSGGVRVEYSINNGESWLDVIAVIPDTGVYYWTIPTDTTSDSCLMRISDTTGNPADTSDSLFAIVSVTSIPIPKLPKVYSLNTKGINAGNLFEIKYAFPEKTEFKLEVYDIKGTKIKEISEENPAGFYSTKIDMSGKPAGVYFIRMEANGKKFTKTNKVVLVK